MSTPTLTRHPLPAALAALAVVLAVDGWSAESAADLGVEGERMTLEDKWSER